MLLMSYLCLINLVNISLFLHWVIKHCVLHRKKQGQFHVSLDLQFYARLTHGVLREDCVLVCVGGSYIHISLTCTQDKHEGTKRSYKHFYFMGNSELLLISHYCLINLDIFSFFLHWVIKHCILHRTK